MYVLILKSEHQFNTLYLTWATRSDDRFALHCFVLLVLILCCCTVG